MGELGWVIVGIGGVLAVLSLVDAFLTILHNDTDGPIIRYSFHGFWKLLIRITRMFPSTRRTLVPLAGPLMIVLAVALWVGIFILGFAFIYWPNLDQFIVKEPLQTGFMAALYFSGTTATVLGYGDLTPKSEILQLVSFLQAGLGFALMTGIITYLINVVSGVSERNALALRLWAITGRTGDGAEAFIRLISYEKPDDIRLRLQNVHDQMYSLHQKMYQFPILDLYYRSRNPVYAPERMLRYAMHVSIAALIISADPKFRQLRIVADELAEVTKDMMHQILNEHLGKAVSEELEQADPGKGDQHWLDQFVSKLEEEFPELDTGDVRQNERILKMILRMRHFLDEMDSFTGWPMDDVLE